MRQVDLDKNSAAGSRKLLVIQAHKETQSVIVSSLPFACVSQEQFLDNENALRCNVRASFIWQNLDRRGFEIS